MASDEWDALYKEFRDFNTNWQRFLRDFLVEMGLRWLAKTKRLTPVGTGDLRNNWQLSQVRRNGNFLEISLYNQKEYAAYVEEGHRVVNREGQTVGWWEGYHMATVSLHEIEAEMERRYDGAFKRFMESLG